MSRIREYLVASKELEDGITCNVDYDRVYEEWDIPLDENLTAHEANMWLHAQLIYHEKFQSVYVIEGMGHEEWDAAVEFVWLCMRHGVMPTTYVKQLIQDQHEFNLRFDPVDPHHLVPVPASRPRPR